MNEIVTFGMNYHMNYGIKVFAKSAIKNADKVTVLGINLEDEVVKFLEETGINHIDVTEICNKHQIPLTLSPYTLKVILFYIYVKEYSESENFYMCDFTDILIQSPPFSLIKEDKCYVSSENQLVGKCQTNTTWIRICYENDMLSLLGKHEILNGGSILGSKKNCFYLLREMVKDCQEIINRIGNYQNIDQASMIKCVYFDKFNYEILRDGSIFNMAYGKEFFPTYRYDRGVVKIKDMIPCVVHQYDVDKQLERELTYDFR